MADRQQVNPYELTAPSGPPPARRFPWISTAFFVFSISALFFVIIVVGQMRGLPPLKTKDVAAFALKVVPMPLVPALVLAAALRVIFFRSTFKPWFYFFLMVCNILVASLLLMTAAFGFLHELGMIG